MKPARLLPLLLISSLALSACGKDDSGNETAAGTGQTASAAGNNSLLALVPADTPYLAGNLAPLPDKLVDSYLKRAEPILAAFQLQMNKFQQQIEKNPEELESDPATRVVLAAMQELDGKLNRAGLEGLGFDLTPEHVIYGMSAFPVMRASLSDADALRATVQRILDRADVAATSLEFQGQAYWRFIPEMHDYDENGNVLAETRTDAEKTAQAIGLYIAILQDHMAVGLLPVADESTVLPSFLAIEKPASSAAASTLKAVNQRFDFSPYGSGVIEFQKLMDQLTSENSLAGQYIKRFGHDLAEFNSHVCRQEISGIIAHTPRAFAGIKELSETVGTSSMVVETESSLASELTALVSDVPVANPKSNYLAELALGLKIGPLRDFLRNKASAVVSAPYQCEALADLNIRAQQAADQLNQPIPPMVNNLFGLRVAIRSIDQNTPESAKGLIALHVTQPEMLVGMAQMLLPNLADMNLVVGAPPARVPADLIPLPGMVVYAAQGKSAIGLSVGEGEQDQLASFINQEGKSNGTFLSVNYDSAAFSEITGQMGEDLPDSDALASHQDFVKQLQEEARKLLDRSDTRLSFSKDGLVIDNSSTLKNP